MTTRGAGVAAGRPVGVLASAADRTIAARLAGTGMRELRLEEVKTRIGLTRGASDRISGIALINVKKKEKEALF